MKRVLGPAALLLAATSVVALAQPRQAAPFLPGEPVGVTVDDVTTPLSDNVKVYGGYASAQSCAFDPTRGVFAVASRATPQNQVANDGYVSLVNPDGSVHTIRWIGINRNGRLVLNQPFGSDIANGMLYVADRDGGRPDPNADLDTPSVATIRMFDLATGTPTGSLTIDGSPGFYDIAVTDDGTIYATQTGPAGLYPPPEDMRVYRIAPDGTATILIQGDPLAGPSGIDLDPDGNLVVANNRDDRILTFAPDGALLTTETGVPTVGQDVLTPGNVGVVVGPDATRYIVSATSGAVTRLPAGGEAEVIASGIPSAESICLDPEAGVLGVPMGPGNTMAFIPLD